MQFWRENARANVKEKGFVLWKRIVGSQDNFQITNFMQPSYYRPVASAAPRTRDIRRPSWNIQQSPCQALMGLCHLRFSTWWNKYNPISYLTSTWDTAKSLMQHLSWHKLTGSLPWKIPSEKSFSVFHHKTAFSGETKYSHKWLERKWLFLLVESASKVERKLGQMEKEKRQVFQELLAFQNTGSMKRSLLKELRVGAVHSLVQKKNSKWQFCSNTLTQCTKTHTQPASPPAICSGLFPKVLLNVAKQCRKSVQNIVILLL